MAPVFESAVLQGRLLQTASNQGGKSNYCFNYTLLCKKKNQPQPTNQTKPISTSRCVVQQIQQNLDTEFKAAIL